MNMQICNNLYVNDVEAMVAFWKKVGFVEKQRQGSGESLNVLLEPFRDSNALFQLFNLEFIKKMSPETADMKPSLLFRVYDITDWHEKMIKITETTSGIVDIGGTKTFNFADPEGNYYAFAQHY